MNKKEIIDKLIDEDKIVGGGFFYNCPHCGKKYEFTRKEWTYMVNGLEPDITNTPYFPYCDTQCLLFHKLKGKND